MRRSITLAGPADGRKTTSRAGIKMAGRQRCRPAIFGSGLNALERAWPQVEYLNSGIAFSSSLVALNTAWSGYHGLGFGAGIEDGPVFEPVPVPAAPVVVGDAGRLPAGLGPPGAPD